MTHNRDFEFTPSSNKKTTITTATTTTSRDEPGASGADGKEPKGLEKRYVYGGCLLKKKKRFYDDNGSIRPATFLLPRRVTGLSLLTGTRKGTANKQLTQRRRRRRRRKIEFKTARNTLGPGSRLLLYINVYIIIYTTIDDQGQESRDHYHDSSFAHHGICIRFRKPFFFFFCPAGRYIQATRLTLVK
jgi:hypothetical protein